MTPTSDLSEMTTIVVGASRGLGRGITTAFAEAGAPVIAVARHQRPRPTAPSERFQHYGRRGGPVAATRLVSLHLRSDASGGTDASDRIAIVRPLAALSRCDVRIS